MAATTDGKEVTIICIIIIVKSENFSFNHKLTSHACAKRNGPYSAYMCLITDEIYALLKHNFFIKFDANIFSLVFSSPSHVCVCISASK